MLLDKRHCTSLSRFLRSDTTRVATVPVRQGEDRSSGICWWVVSHGVMQTCGVCKVWSIPWTLQDCLYPDVVCAALDMHSISTCRGLRTGASIHEIVCRKSRTSGLLYMTLMIGDCMSDSYILLSLKKRACQPMRGYNAVGAPSMS